MSLEIRDAVRELAARWLRRGHDLALGMGIAQGFATLGRIGFEGRFDYSAIGSVTNLVGPAVRRRRVHGRCWSPTASSPPSSTRHARELVGDVQPKGFSRSVRVHNIIGRSARD